MAISVTALGVNSFSAYSDEKLSRDYYFLFDETPEKIDELVSEYFLSFSSNELFELGFSPKEILNLELRSAVTSYEYDKCDAKFYYYPVVSGKNIVATITSYVDMAGEISVNLVKGRFADALNKLDSSEDCPQALIISKDAMYAIDRNNTLKFLYSFVDGKFVGEKEQVRVSFEEIEKEKKYNSKLKSLAILDEKKLLENNIKSISSYSLNIPIVPNDSPSSYPGGVCWASSCSSIILYSMTLGMTPIQLRDYLVSVCPAGTGNISSVNNILTNYGFNTTTDTSDAPLSYSNIQTLINAGHPIYTHWVYFENNLPKKAHAMVLRGYYYNTSLPLSTRSVTIMDPNETNYISKYYNQNSMPHSISFAVGTKVYYWCCSIYY